MVVFHQKPILFWNMVVLFMCCSLRFHCHSHLTIDVSGVLFFMFILPQPFNWCVHFTIAKKVHVLLHGHTTIAIQVMWIIFMCCSLCLLCHSQLTIFLCFSANVLHDYCTIAKKAHSCFSCSLCNSHLNLSNVLYVHLVISI